MSGAQSPQAGQQGFSTGLDEFNATAFLVSQMLTRLRTASFVKVISCSNSGGVAPVGTVAVQPLVNQVDGSGNATPHGTIYNLPYFRLQAGNNAIICDPQPGDLGMMVVCDRDTSSAKANKGQANPGSRRRNDMADSFYFGGYLNALPANYVQFTGGQINVVATSSVTVTAPTVTVNATNSITLQSASIVLDGDVSSTGTFTNNGIDISSTHKHGGVTAGGSDTGVPV